MGKSTIQDLAATLIQRRDMGKKEASQFVNEMFFVIQKALDQDKLVKVKGLGTFKIIDVEDRESVDVNTGDRVLIEGHGKITFTPDSLMKELVNKPFSQFETVVLKDGVEFDEEKPSAEATPAEETPAEAMTAEEIPAGDGVVDKSVSDNPEDAPLVDFVTDDEPVEVAFKATLEEEPEQSDQETAEEVDFVDTAPELGVFDKFKEMVAIHQKAIISALVACVACFVSGYLLGSRYTGDVWTPDDAYMQARTVEQIMQETEESEQPALQPAEVQSLPEPQTAKEEPKSESQPAQEQPQPEPKSIEHAEPIKEELDKYAKMDARIRTGAYRIVGTDQVYTVKSGDNLKIISRFFFGPDMDCYVETYNGLNANSELKVGQKINIPKLVHKKQVGKKK